MPIGQGRVTWELGKNSHSVRKGLKMLTGNTQIVFYFLGMSGSPMGSDLH